jgi:hypothetical protein
VTDEDSLCAVLGAGRMELSWPFVLMHCSPWSATENKYHQFKGSWWLKQMCLHFILHCIAKKKGDIKKSENKN